MVETEGEQGKKCEDDRVRRLRWRCRRGLLELDVWLGRFIDSLQQPLTKSEAEHLDSLLREADADLLAWLQEQQTPPNAHAEMLARIRATV